LKSDIVVIGAGIVGLATAYQIQKKAPHLSIVVLDKEKTVSAHQTGHNSGVIHSGLYYKPGSLKALNCIEGYHMLLKFCDQYKVPYEITGKVVVATNKEEIPYLEQLFDRGLNNGLEGIKKIHHQALKEKEPFVNGVAAIHVPQTGIIDYKLVSNRLAQVVTQGNCRILLQQEVENIHMNKGETIVITNKKEIKTRMMINCAGLYSDKIAKQTHPELEIRIIPFRGEYYKLKNNKKYLVKNLIYPVPDPNFPFLGVHFTRMIDGNVEAGPNAVLAFAREGYKKSIIKPSELIDSLIWPGFQKVAKKYWRTGMGEMYRSFSKKAFTKALQKLMPAIKEDDLISGGAGVRAQACDKNGGLLDDFSILESKSVINVINAPSPAATSSLSIGDKIAEMALQNLKT
jgi:(S)-2-hydroxyglutarate dehydrogenase